ncbi:Rrn9p NDAI_0K00490 [Naumovozyma dairenensis CBS 421]|uniref:Rrn9 domain-containing protein n=1 Tax=Naumovozyma dairenensis (strain ATCC 10597 / BCRC 20456 / CBS 421 / NBRC 0211 / NRRL Y-12639) TaxID=1071378 RepID=G0WHH9_NAUDC|nr:hypothetical protein NDAI_0K00490 [Naumovozyma dairenensis CBS 421]CCD27240.1 hypothetical protein NDAI_0K00490 [Naumovozyma dairenensis CBS 421]
MTESQSPDIGNEPSTQSQGSLRTIMQSKKIAQEERELILTANDLLDSLEHSHRTDLTLHLYSSFLLKRLLTKANQKKYPYETEQFIKTQIKDNWVSWPNANTVIDPQSDKLYEDGIEEHTNLQPGEVSHQALLHSSNALKSELNATWEQCLSKSAKVSGAILDVDKLNIPNHISNRIIDKLDDLFMNLHDNVAIKNKLQVKPNKHSENHEILISQTESLRKKPVKANTRIRLDYLDVISTASSMGEDMKDIYMKSLKLYNDIPNSFDKSKFKIPKHVLKKYKLKKNSASDDSNVKKILKKSNRNFVTIKKLLKDKRLNATDKLKFKVENDQYLEQMDNLKTFLQIQRNQSKAEGDTYDVEDCLVRLRR